MDDTLKQPLLRKADRFRVWAGRAWANRDAEPLSAEWETQYEEWDAIYEAFTHFVQTCPHELWDTEVKEALLYLIARDNESEFLVDVVAEDTARLLALAGDAVASEERDARWQFAERLGGLHERQAEAEALLTQFARDDEEYVTRCALLALGRLGSQRVEGLAEVAWGTGHEYQQIAALHVLQMVGSPRLSEYLARAEADGRSHLVASAAKIRSGNVDG